MKCRSFISFLLVTLFLTSHSFASLSLNDFIQQNSKQNEKDIDNQIKKLKEVAKKTDTAEKKGELLLRLVEMYTEKANFSKSRDEEFHTRNLAIDECRTILKKGMREVINDRLFYYLAINLYSVGKKFEAGSIFGNLERNYPSSEFIHIVYSALGEYRLGLKDYSKAESYFNKAISLKIPSSTLYAFYMLALLQIEQNNPAKGIDKLNSILASIKKYEGTIPEQTLLNLKKEIYSTTVKVGFKRAQKSGDFESYKSIIPSFEGYFSHFPDSASDDEVRFWYAFSLYQVEDYENAKRAFRKIIDKKKSMKFVSDSLQYLITINAVVAYGKEAKQARSIATIKISENLNKDKEIIKLEIPQPEMELIESCEEYIKVVNKKTDMVSDVEFLVGKIYYKYNHFTEGRKHFEGIISKFADKKIAKLSVNYVLDSLKYEKLWKELYVKAVQYLKIPILANGALRSTLISTKEETTLRYLDQSFLDKKYAESGSGYYNYYKSNSKSKISQFALTRAIESFIKINNKKMVSETTSILISNYPINESTAETLYNVSLYYYRNFYFLESATLGEKLAGSSLSFDFSKKALILSIKIREDLDDKSKLAEDLILFSEKFSLDPLASEYLIKAYQIYFTSKISGWKSEDMLDILKTEKKNSKNYLLLAKELIRRFYETGKIKQARQIYDEAKRTVGAKSKDSVEYKFLLQVSKYEEGAILLNSLAKIKSANEFKKSTKLYTLSSNLFKEAIDLPDNELVIGSYLQLGILSIMQSNSHKLFEKNIAKSIELRNDAISYFNKAMDSAKRFESYNSSYFLAKDNLTKLGYFNYKEFGEPLTKYLEFFYDSIFDLKISDKTNRIGEIKDTFNLAVQNFRLGNLSEAKNLFSLCIKKDPVFSEAYLNLGLIYEIEGVYDKATELYTQLLELDSGFLESNFALIRIDVRENRFDAGRIKLEPLLKKYPKNKKLQYYMIDLLRLNKKYSQSLQLCYKMLSKNLEDKDVLIRIAVAKAQMNKFGEAKLMLENISEKYPTDISSLINLAILYGKSGEYQKTLVFLRKALDLDNQNSAVYENLAKLYFDLASFENAIKQLDLLIKTNPSYYPAYHDLVLSYIAISKKEIALAKLINTATHFVENKLLIYKIAKLYYDMKDYDNALQYFKKYLTLTENMPKERDGGFKTARSAEEYIEKIGELK